MLKGKTKIFAVILLGISAVLFYILFSNTSTNATGIESETAEEEKIPPETNEELSPETNKELPPERNTESVSESDTENQIEINGEKAIVYNQSDIFTAIGSADITYIELGNNIELDSLDPANYKINSSKTSLTIEGKGYTLTDPPHTDSGYTLKLTDEGRLKNITLHNLKIMGRNHYGTVYVSASKVSVTYDKITYKGPQLGHNINGTVTFRDCSLNLQTTFSSVGEAAEAGAVTLEGNINIEKNTSNADEIFFIKDASGIEGKFLIKTGAVVKITNTLYQDSGLVYSEKTDYMIEIENGAYLDYKGHSFILENLRPSNFIIHKSAQVYLTLIKTGVRPALAVKSFTAYENSVFHFFAGKGSDSRRLITLGSGGAVFDNPKSVILQNLTHVTDGALISGYDGNSSLEIKTEQINQWSGEDAGSFSHLPDYHWRMADENLVFSGIVNTSSLLLDSSTNYNYQDEEDNIWLNGGELNSSTFLNGKAKTVSFGYLPFTAEYLGRDSAVSGETDPESDVKVFLKNDFTAVWGPVQAKGNGLYMVDTDPAADPDLLASAHHLFLYRVIPLTAEPPVFQIIYHGNGNTSGDPPIDDKEYMSGNTASVHGKNTLSKEGYFFGGWNTKQDGKGEFYQENDELKITEDTTLYAVWKKGYTLSYSKNDGPDSETLEHPGPYFLPGTELTLLTLEEAGWNNSGFRFLGWSETSDGTSGIWDSKKWIVTENDIVLYALWEKITADFSFYKIDGESKEIFLPGADFSLFYCDNLHEENHDMIVTQNTSDCWELLDTQTSDTNGYTSFSSLAPGDYMLVETKAPPGYELPEGQWQINLTLIDESVQIAVTAAGSQLPPGFIMEGEGPDTKYLLPNIEKYNLPMAGGSGILPYILFGIVMVTCALLLFLYIRKLRKKGIFYENQ